MAGTPSGTGSSSIQSDLLISTLASQSRWWLEGPLQATLKSQAEVTCFLKAGSRLSSDQAMSQFLLSS